MSSSNKTYRITIVGAGIIGLTTACTILKEYAANENLQLTIISESFSPHTTGDISAGYWEPYGIEVIDKKVLRWAGYTYDIFVNEFFSTKAASAGLARLPSYMLQKFEKKSLMNKKPAFASLVRHSRMLDKHELQMFDHWKPKVGFSMSSIAVDMTKYLPQLQRYLAQDSRVRFIQRKIHSFTELRNTTDVLINCSGLASRYLAGDETIRPARGQVIRVHAPWIKAAYQFHTDEGMGYIIPLSDCVVLGGTFQLDDWSQLIRDEDTRNILQKCTSFLPALKQVRYGKVQVGLRPHRDGGVRLEHERTTDGIDIVHCYGHSGSGVTLSWGCAKDVVEIVKTLLPPNPKRENSADERLPEHEQLWRLVPNLKYILLRAKL